MLGSGSAAQVPEDSTADEDGAFETKDANAVTLYKVSDSSGSLKVDQISTKPIRQDMLKSEVSDIFGRFLHIFFEKVSFHFQFRNICLITLLNIFVSGLLHFGHRFSHLRVGWKECDASRENSIIGPCSQ